MENLTIKVVMQNRYGIPCIGFGTWQTPDRKTAVDSVKSAVSAECLL